MRWLGLVRTIPLLVATLIATAAPVAAQSQYSRLCDPAFENCRTPLIELIRNETVGIDVAFWFMEDSRYASELIARWRAGVPVRVVMDTQALTEFHYDAEVPIQMFKDAGIPIREKTGSSGILHFKMMLFAGQNVVEFSGANYSSEAFVPIIPYENYVDEVIVFSDQPSIVNSFKTKYDDIWTDVTTGSQKFSNYANITPPLVRNYPTYPLDPELQFSPWTGFASRSVARYKAETVANNGKIDAIMFRITDRRHSDQMIAAVARGVPVRLITEQEQYRHPLRLWHSWNVDRMYMAGIQVRFRAHDGLSHEKLTVLRGQHMAIMGSSNWTSASDSSQHEHNIFTTRDWMYNWAVDHFERKWNNLAPAPETMPFVPLPPDAPIAKQPLDGAQNQPLTVTLKWNAGLWAHKYDVFFGSSPTNMTKLVNDQELGPSESSSDLVTWNVGGLTESTIYYWKVVSRTMANMEKAGPVWSFRTTGAPPAAGPSDVVLWAAKAPSIAGWSVVSDTSAAGGKRLASADLKQAKLAAPLATPTKYFEMGFFAEANVPYRLWIRGKAERNSYENDSVFVQFSDSVTSSGAAQWRVGTTSATTVSIEDCSGCGLAGWGWQDTATGAGVLGPLVYFSFTGNHTIRVQVREDGLSIDQIILSRDGFMSSSPGLPQNDGTIFSEQGSAALDPNGTPTVNITAPAASSQYTAPAAVTISANAADSDGTVARVDFFANGALVGSDATAPFSITWSVSAPGTKSLTAQAVDNRGASTTSSPVSIVINPAVLEPGEEVVLYASTAPVAIGWNVTADTSAAGGHRLQNPNAAAPKLAAPLAAPSQYFEMTFNALAGRPYRLWIRGKATSNSYENDSVYVQFDNSVAANGTTPMWRTGTTEGAMVSMEDCTSCGLAGWGWQDTATGAGVLGPVVYFASDGPQTIRVQTREDGLGIDQVVLSSFYYTTAAPGTTKNDNTILGATP
jgi:phosphatidylserine/phosphatidylglycerophosphate/cardiolipin synthase-like enzyme